MTLASGNSALIEQGPFSDSENQRTASAFDLQGDDLKRLMARVRSDLALAKGRKASLNTRVKSWRKILDLEPKAPPYEDAPDMTMPLTRTKRDGVVAHLHDALDVEPFFAAQGFTEEAMEIAPIYEAVMERELVAGDSRDAYLMALREAVDVGTGVLGWSLAMSLNGEPVIQESLTRFENFYAYPVAVDDLTNCSTFRRYKEPWFVLKRMADAGLLDGKLVEQLKGGGGGGPELVHEEERDLDRDSSFSEEQEQHMLWECYVRFEGELWQLRFSERMNDALSAKRNPFSEAFDAPPYEIFRIMRKPGYLWGASIPQLLESIQKIMDFAENSRAAYNQIAISPVIMADRMNPFTQQLRKGGILPGMVIPTMGSPELNGIKTLEFPPPQATVEDMSLAQRFADMATFNDFQVAGDPFAAGRRTATEVRTSFNIGTLKLRRMLGDIRGDLARAAKKRWALTELFKVRPRGVVSAYRDGKQFLISSDGVEPSTIESLAAQFMQMNPMTITQYQGNPMEFLRQYQLVNGGIPGMKRDDIRWVPNGGDVIPDKVAEIQKLDGFAPYMNWLGAAQTDERIWYFLKVRLQYMGRADWRRLIGDNPKVRLDEQQYMNTMAMLTQTSAQLANNGSQVSGFGRA